MRGKLKCPPGTFVILVALPESTCPDGEPIGVVEMYKDGVPDIAKTVPLEDGERGFGWLASMAVSKPFHRQGLGSALVQASLQPVYEKWGYTRIALHVFEDNEAAVALYKRNGFEVVSSRPKVWMQWLKQRDELLMTRRIGP
jgi:ribosomal protein S18 acetylase RimI-like enzyme